MSMKTKAGIGAVMAVLLLGAYALATQTKEAADSHSARVVIDWAPKSGSSGVVIIVRAGMVDHVKAKTFKDGPFDRTYHDLKRGQSILATTDPVRALNQARQITCAIIVDGQERVANSGDGHVVCLTTVP